MLIIHRLLYEFIPLLLLRWE